MATPEKRFGTRQGWSQRKRHPEPLGRKDIWLSITRLHGMRLLHSDARASSLRGTHLLHSDFPRIAHRRTCLLHSTTPRIATPRQASSSLGHPAHRYSAGRVYFTRPPRASPLGWSPHHHSVTPRHSFYNLINDCYSFLYALNPPVGDLVANPSRLSFKKILPRGEQPSHSGA